jgi:hypothetical protein
MLCDQAQESSMIHIEDHSFQLFCLLKYTEPTRGTRLTEMQAKVRSAINLCNGDRTAAAKHVGISLGCLQGHVSGIKSKGWELKPHESISR